MVAEKIEKLKAIWKTSDDTRAFLMTHLRKMSFRDVLLLSFYAVSIFVGWKALGKVPVLKFLEPDDRVSQSQWFYGQQRLVWNGVLHDMLAIMSKIRIPHLDFKPLQWLFNQVYMWYYISSLTTDGIFLGTHEFGEYFEKGIGYVVPGHELQYWKPIPFEFRVIILLGVVSLMFIFQKLTERFIDQIGGLVPG